MASISAFRLTTNYIAEFTHFYLNIRCKELISAHQSRGFTLESVLLCLFYLGFIDLSKAKRTRNSLLFLKIGYNIVTVRLYGMLQVKDLNFQYGEDTLFSEVDFSAYPGQRLAVVGRNGVGKTTLFKLLLGRLSPSLGEVNFPKDWQVGYMAQETAESERSALDYVIDGHRDLRRVEKQIEKTEDSTEIANLHVHYADLGGYESAARAGAILYGLGFAANEIDKPFKEFSGGWRIRLNLAQALMAPSDLLLLDEPTNHLDLEAILWLEKWLKEFVGTLIFIAHDRAFLDAVATQVLHLGGGTGRSYNGNYSTFERRRIEQLEQEQALQKKRENQVRHIQQFIDRFRAKDSKAKQVQSRIKALERMQAYSSIQVDSQYQVNFEQPDKVSSPLMTFRGLDIGYGQSVILNQVSQTILPGARIGILGVNGAGKSTLLKALVGDLQPISGNIERGVHSKISYFAQHQLESLDSENSALASIQKHYPQLTGQEARDYLGGWGFDGTMVARPINSLSGGEKARFVLALLASERPAMLILDEPTNHLDLDMRDALAIALQSYSGAVLIVAHDRDLLEKLVDEFWLVGGGSLTEYTADLNEYTGVKQAHALLAEGEPRGMDDSKRSQRQERARIRESLNDLKIEVKEVEKNLERKTAELSVLEGRLADKKTYEGLAADELQELMTKAAQCRKKKEALEERWLELSSQLEMAGTEIEK